MPAAIPLAALVLALDGESVTNNNALLGVLSIVSIVFGYVLIAALWWFVFRPGARAARKRRRDREP
jgi:Na+/proline symporter